MISEDTAISHVAARILLSRKVNFGCTVLYNHRTVSDTCNTTDVSSTCTDNDVDRTVPYCRLSCITAQSAISRICTVDFAIDQVYILNQSRLTGCSDVSSDETC